MAEPDFLRDTRASYDTVATVYAERFGDELDAKPLDRAMLAGFAELVRAAGAGPVADVECGTGRVTAYLDGLGVADVRDRSVAGNDRGGPADIPWPAVRGGL